MKFNLNKITNRKLLVISVCTFILCLVPYICSSGYMSDDVANINVSGIKYFYSLFGFTIYIIKKWMKLGRFYPFAFYSYYFFDFIQSRLIYKIIILLTTVIDALLIYKIIKKILDEKTAIISLIIFPLFCTLSATYIPPLYSQHMLIQIMFAECLLALYLTISYMEEGKIWKIVIASLLYAFALCTYEISFTFIFLFVLIYFYFNKSNSIWPIYFVFISITTVNIFLRLFMVERISHTKVNLNFIIVLKTFFSQLTGSFPIIRYFVETKEKGLFIFQISWWESLIIFFWCLVTGYIIYHSSLNNKKNQKRNLIFLTIFGAYLTFAPAALTSLSQAHQGEISLGIGYFTFLISSFGMAVLLSVIIQLCNNKKIVLIVILPIMLISGTLNSVNARVTIEKYYRNTAIRDLIKRSVKNNILSDITDNDIIIDSTKEITHTYLTSMYSKFAHRKIHVISEDEYINSDRKNIKISFFDEYFHDFNIKGKIYRVEYKLLGNNRGIFVLREVDSNLLPLNNTKIYLDKGVNIDWKRDLEFSKRNIKEIEKYVVTGKGDTSNEVTITNGKRVLIVMKLEGKYRRGILKLGIYDIWKNKQKISIYANNENIYNDIIKGRDLNIKTKSFNIPEDRKIYIEIFIPNATSPKEEKINSDERIMGFSIKNIEIESKK